MFKRRQGGHGNRAMSKIAKQRPASNSLHHFSCRNLCLYVEYDNFTFDVETGVSGNLNVSNPTKSQGVLYATAMATDSCNR